ncbi:DUF362 domain-containing protein [Thermanaerosceptrum fracticalcis]|uniref:DUF362 domain-containing protein n=1 Tax=Thermanaerosceptrum fracticalcis TaxID=1712410 RepID=A0A7G6E1S8_THEFR|nr:DUF362 domain-containing protein [Thermanaerosceptrum fracticalcis]QNB46032.1 DUF362 domain-containing protein [Thermanaerosceptrum fracticalcis]
MNTKGKVAIVHKGVNSTYETIKKAVDLLGGIGRFVKPGQKVMLKPNYTGNLLPETGSVTSLAVLEGIIVMLQEVGIENIIIGEGCGTVHVGTSRIFENVGVSKLAERYNVMLRDLNLDKMITVKDKRFKELKEVKVAETVYNVDLIINIPMLKTHPLTDVTLSLKNMKGVIAPSEKRRFHNINLHQAVADLHLVLPKYLTIADGLIAQEGLGPAEGTPVPLGLIIAGDNPVAVDSVCSRIMGFNPADIRHIRYSAEIGIGSYSLNDIEIVGATIESVARKFEPAVTALKEYPGVEIYSSNPCSGCIAALVIALDRMLKMGDLVKFEGLQICLGSATQNIKNIKRLFYLGNCTKQNYEKSKCNPNVHYIEGCAPPGLEVEERIREVYGIPRSNPLLTSSNNSVN